MKSELKARIKHIKESLPKATWADAIKAVSVELAEPEKIEVLNLGKIEGEELNLAKAIMNDGDGIIIRYLRSAPTVALAVKQADVDAPVVRQKVICSGAPYGVMVAFMHAGKLYIGWSRRHSGKILQQKLIRTLFEDTIKMMKDPRMVEKVSVDKASSNYEALLGQFAKSMREFLSGDCFFDEIEDCPFAKKTGKLTAIMRGLKDTINLNGKVAISTASGPMPTEVARNLPWFIQLAEEKFKTYAANVDKTTNAKLLAAGN